MRIVGPRRPGRPTILSVLAAAALLIVASVVPASAAPTPSSGIDVRLPLGHQIRGFVRSPSGDPVAGAGVNASDDNVSVNAVTGADGSYVIHAVGDGTYRVHAADDPGAYLEAYYGVPDSTTDFSAAALVTVSGADVSGIDIRLFAKPATGISGTVRDPDGHPLGGVDISANGDAGGAGATTASDGTYRIAGLGAGDYQLFVSPSDGSDLYGGPVVDGSVGLPESEPTIVTVADSDTAGVDVALVRGRTISGRVTLARPATVEAIVDGPSSTRSTIDGTGHFSVHGLIPGEYRVIFRDVVPGPEQTETGNFPYGAYGPGGSLVTQDAALGIDVTNADATLATVAIPRGTDITGQVTDGKTGLANAYLFVCGDGGGLGCASAVGVADGTFRILHVPTGSFTIFVSVPGRVSGYYLPNGFTIDQFAAGSVKVVSGRPDVKGIKIAVPPGATVTGRITGPSNEPVVGADVSVSPFGIPPNWLQPRSDATGRYRQTGIPTNEYGLYVSAPTGSDYMSGYYRAGAPGHYTADYTLGSTFRVVEPNDHEAPTIADRDPAPNATNVAVDATLSIRFSEPVDGVSPSTVQLRDPAGHLVPASVTFTPIERTARITPAEELRSGTKYKVTLTSALVDWSNNRFAGASWSFTTSP